MIVVGMMTGTSIDGIDAALIRTEGRGLDRRASLVRHVAAPLGDLEPELRAAAAQTPMRAGAFADLAWRFGTLHAEVIAELLGDDGPPDLIAAHGQTVFHEPPVSWQLLNPAPIAERFGCRVVCDLRQADLAAGGQGAPISPLGDWVLFADEQRRRVIVNLGGFCNVTFLPRRGSGGGSVDVGVDGIAGMDVCACNHVLDGVARRVLGARYDEGGRAARAGRVDAARSDELLTILRGQSAAGRTLGTGDEAGVWIDEHADGTAPEDLAASAVHAVATCIADRLGAMTCDQILVAGGGAHNDALMDALRDATDAPIETLDVIGVPVAAREAAIVAVLGALVADDVPITLPRVTGRI